jgi:glycosidase
MSQSLETIDFKQLASRNFTTSPSAWEDKVFYFLLLDRFSDNKEAGFAPAGDGGGGDAGSLTLLYNTTDSGNAITTGADALAWRIAGTGWTGGTIKGVQSKLAYLSDMGVTALWISPVFKQVFFHDTYHGYAIQDFLEVDSHFGTLADLRELVDAAHALGIAVILDIVVNHSGDVFSYEAVQPKWTGSRYKVKGFNNAAGEPDIPFVRAAAAGPDDAIWPMELRDPDVFTQKGQIVNWDASPEFLEGDFFDLKDIHLGQGPTDEFTAAAGLLHLVEVYKYWMAILDIDGYRIDTVKHMEDGAVRHFASAIHEFAQYIGKDKFLLIGEITGSRDEAIRKLQVTGIDSALGIADVQGALGDLVKGKVTPETYFNLFRNSFLVGKGSHTWFRNRVVVMLDDHDKIIQENNKSRFCALDEGDKLIFPAIAINLTTLGIPCIYYGSEQQFDGSGSGVGCDEYIREAMFGGPFGAFRSKDRHFFDVSGAIYKEVAKITAIRRQHVTLRRGRQYQRAISGDGLHFGLPSFMGGATRIRSVIAWSRLLDEEELVLAINTDTTNALSVWVTIDNGLQNVGDVFTCIYPDDPILPEAIVENRNGKAMLIKVAPAGFVIYKRN